MSIKFPSLYKVAAQLLQKASEEDINVKHILYNNRKYRHHNIKSIYAVVTKALQNWDAIECLLKESNILKEHTGLDVWRIRVVISEVVFNQKEFPNPENYTLKTVIDYEEKFKKILSKKQTKALIGSNVNSETDVTKVRFVKVNLIKDDVNSVIEAFIEEGWQKLKTASNYQDYLQQLKDLEPSSSVFLQDFHFPEVLAFPPRTELQFHELYTNGSVFFMDKSSCLAPFLVAPERNSEVLDMCAAPGLKTVQLASYVTSGKVYAVEKDEERYDSLEKMVKRSGADNVITILKDVTTLKTDKFKHVEYILVDPSCSGSGIRKRQPSTSSKDRMDEKTRIEKLSGFQVTLLRFAFTKFPAAKRVVYSTCSLNVEENEQVVESALNSYNHNFNIVSVQDKLPEWQNFGSKEFQFGNKCIYCKPEIDQTNGFFVAVFERDESRRSNLSFSSKTCNGKSVNRIKGKKRTHEENFNNENNYAKVPPIKRHKLNKVPSERKEENQVVSTKSGDISGQQKVNIKSNKESLSEKKRSRKRRLKIKRKVFPDSQKHKKLKVKVNNNGSNNVIEKQDSTLCVKENSNKISKAKLRHNRMKKMKLNSSLGSVASNGASNSLNVEDNTDDKSKLKKRKNFVNSLQESTSGLSEIENKKVTKNKKKEQILEATGLNENETVKVKPIDSSKHLVEISSKNDQNHNIVLHKHKHKKRQVLEESVCIADAGDKMEEEIHVEGKVKKKHKKNHEKDNSENACTADAGDKLEEEIHVKSKHKKKHKENHETDNSENVCTANAGNKLEEEIHVKSKHKKKHKEKQKEESLENVCVANASDKLEVEIHFKSKHKKKHKENHEKGNLENDSCVADVGDKLEEEVRVKSKHKKKHKEKQKEESLENVCVANASDKLEEEIHFKSKHKKKHKENHEKESLENACIADIGDKLEEEMLRYDVKNKHKKKHKKQHEETLEMFN